VNVSTAPFLLHVVDCSAIFFVGAALVSFALEHSLSSMVLNLPASLMIDKYLSNLNPLQRSGRPNLFNRSGLHE